MNEIITVERKNINGVEVNSVNSRDIYEYLEVDSRYNDWIQRAIDKYEFEENIDYSKLSNGTARGIDFIVTLDMAKELCMVSSTSKGKETRKYFIEVEKQSNRPLSITEQISLIAKGYHQADVRLSKLEETKRLENWQEKSLQDAKNKKVYEIAKDDKRFAIKLHRKVWSLFKKQFNLPRFNELPALKYDEGISYINNLTFADMVG